METSDSTATAAGKPMELMMLFDFWFTLDSVCHVLGPKKKILSCKSHDLSGLLTKVNLFLFFFYHPNLTHPATPPCLRTSFPVYLLHHIMFSVLSLFLFPTFLSIPLLSPPLCRVPTCDFFLSRSSFSLLLYLFTSSPFPPAPSLSPPPSPLLWQAAHCSESVSWRQAAGLPQRWGVQHWVCWEPQPHPAMTSWTGKRAA